MKKLKFGVVGVNNRGRDVMGEVIGKSSFELRAICDINEQILDGAVRFFEEKA